MTYPTHQPMGMHQQMAMRGQQEEAEKQAADAKQQVAVELQQQAQEQKAAADAKHEAAQEHDKSAAARAQHPPDDHAADQAFLAEQNAENKDLRDERPELKGDNRDDHGQQPGDDNRH